MTTDAINRVKEAEMKAKSLIDEAKQQAIALKKNSEKECESISEKEIKFSLVNEGELLAKPVIEKARVDVDLIKSVDNNKLESVVNSIVERIVSVNGNS